MFNNKEGAKVYESMEMDQTPSSSSQTNWGGESFPTYITGRGVKFQNAQAWLPEPVQGTVIHTCSEKSKTQEFPKDTNEGRAKNSRADLNGSGECAKGLRGWS